MGHSPRTRIQDEKRWPSQILRCGRHVDLQAIPEIGPTLLGAWLVASGLLALIPIGIPFSGTILNLLAVAAGALILMDR